MTDFILIREGDFAGFKAARKALDELRTQLNTQIKSLEHELDRLESGFEGSGRIEIDPAKLGFGNGASDTPERESKLYKIGRARGQHSYSEVAWREVEKPEFTLDEGWRIVEPIIITKSDRGRDSFRRSLDRDERFTRVEKDDNEIWFRRRDANQMELQEA